MAATPIFHGRIRADGQLELDAAEQSRRRAYLRWLAGRDVEIVIRRQRAQRSLDQNAYLHAVVFPLLATELGDSVEGVKFDLMGERFGWTTTARGHHIPVKAHTAAMTVEECTAFIDWVIPWALTTHGIEIPLPNEVTA